MERNRRKQPAMSLLPEPARFAAPFLALFLAPIRAPSSTSAPLPALWGGRMRPPGAAGRRPFPLTADARFRCLQGAGAEAGLTLLLGC